MNECWALFDKQSNCWHCDIAGNVSWWPTKESADAQIQSFSDRSRRLSGGDRDGSSLKWLSNVEARLFVVKK